MFIQKLILFLLTKAILRHYSNSTKDGDFRCGLQNNHDVDCIVEVKDGLGLEKEDLGLMGR